jgi:hypothetical protein
MIIVGLPPNAPAPSGPARKWVDRRGSLLIRNSHNFTVVSLIIKVLYVTNL